MGTPVVVVCGMVTVLFAMVAAHALGHGFRSRVPGPRDRVDHFLHAAMALAMAAMPWSSGRALPAEPMTVLFAAAALWFPLTATGRRSAHRTVAVAGRLPYAAGMAAMAWMLRTPHGGAGPAHENLAGGAPPSHQAAGAGHAAGAPAAAAAVTVLLACYLMVCALRSLTRPMPPLWSAAGAARRAAARAPLGHVRDGVMALGTAVMLLMPH